MPFVVISVKTPRNRLIYIDGRYGEPAGNSSTDTFTVPVGGHTVETLDGQKRIDHRFKFSVTVRSDGAQVLQPGNVEIPANDVIPIVLASVSPPQPI